MILILQNLRYERFFSFCFRVIRAETKQFDDTFLRKHLQEFSTYFDEDGICEVLKRFEDKVVLKNTARLLRKVKKMMAKAVVARQADSKTDLVRALSEIGAVIRESGVFKALQVFLEENPDTRRYYNKSALKNRGWTDAMIREFLEQPDIDVTPQCGFQGYRSYYLDMKVEAVERTPEFKKIREQKQQRANARANEGGAK